MPLARDVGELLDNGLDLARDAPPRELVIDERRVERGEEAAVRVVVVVAVRIVRGRVAEVEAVGLCWIVLGAGCQGQAEAEAESAWPCASV